MRRRLRPHSLFPIFAAAAALCAVASTALCQATPRDIEALSKASLIYIATVRKDGNQSRSTPVWFTTTSDHAVLLETGPNTWKAKRIRRGSPALIWIGSEDGPAFVGKAEITKDSAVTDRIIADYPNKYLAAKVGLFRPTSEKFADGKIVAIKITVVRDLPEGFRSNAGTPAPTLENAAKVPAP